MADLKLLTERVVEKEKAAIRKEVADKTLEAEDKVKDEKSKLDKKLTKQKQTIDQKSDQQYKIRKNTLEIHARNEKLAEKQNVLSKVLTEVIDTLNQMDQASFQSFLTDVLNQFSGTKDLEIVLGEESVGLIDETWLNQLEHEGKSFTLSNDVIPKKGGVVIREPGIEYNFIFEELVENMKAELSQKISLELFE